MTNSTTDITRCGVANPGGTPCTKPKGHDGGHDLAAYGSLTDIPILDDDAIADIAEMFPHAEYQPTLSPDEVDPCEFCKGTIDDHKANCVVPHVHALCQTVRVLRAENERLATVSGEWAGLLDRIRAWSKCADGYPLDEHINNITVDRERLQSQLEQVTKERNALAAALERELARR